MLKNIALLFILLLMVKSVYASDRPNNKFGIHLAQPHLSDLQQVAELVNRNGDWGYITLVLQEDDRDKGKWQEIFDRLRELHLIPIIRLATKPEGENWRRPEVEEADSWANFLDSLNWVTKKRYIILFNEPNHGSEWGGEVDVKSYTKVAAAFTEKLKAKNQDFFVMLAGFDASAPSWMPGMEDEAEFLRQIFNFQFSIFNLIDGWASHSYPNPGFSGSPFDSGQGTIRTYRWEVSMLWDLGVYKKLPIFITETGWKRTIQNSEFIIQNYFQQAYENVWLPDENVIAVTPFVFDYQGQPFLDFSWKKFQSDQFFAQYHTVQSMAKVKGSPERIDRGQIHTDLPKQLVGSSSYHFRITIRNTGQAIWDKNDGYVIRLENLNQGNYFFSDLKKIVPLEDSTVDLYLKTNGIAGKYDTRIILMQGDQKIAESARWQFEVVPLPSLKFNVGLMPKLLTKGNDFEIQIFDKDQELVLKRKGIKVAGNNGILEDIQNIVPGDKYRVVILKPYYLPRQRIITLKKGINSVRFESMLPLDFDKNGHWDGGDINALSKNWGLLGLFFP